MNRIIPGIRQHNPDAEYDTPERCSIIEVSNDSDDEAVSIARATVLPGVTTAWHHLVGTAERYLIVSGSGLVEIGDAAPAQVSPGDVVRIPPGVRQRISNNTDTNLVFYAVCSPRFKAENYINLD